MTAEELALTIYRPINMTCNEFAIKLAVEFAKIKVIEALKTASEKAEIKIKYYYNESYSLVKSETVKYNSSRVQIEVFDESIINAYHLTPIK